MDQIGTDFLFSFINRWFADVWGMFQGCVGIFFEGLKEQKTYQIHSTKLTQQTETTLPSPTFPGAMLVLQRVLHVWSVILPTKLGRFFFGGKGG